MSRVRVPEGVVSTGWVSWTRSANNATCRGHVATSIKRVPEGVVWPVGQVVKTAASHAVNIGSNPVRVIKILDKRKRVEYNTLEESDALKQAGAKRV